MSDQYKVCMEQAIWWRQRLMLSSIGRRGQTRRSKTTLLTNIVKIKHKLCLGDPSTLCTWRKMRRILLQRSSTPKPCARATRTHVPCLRCSSWKISGHTNSSTKMHSSGTNSTRGLRMRRKESRRSTQSPQAPSRQSYNLGSKIGLEGLQRRGGDKHSILLRPQTNRVPMSFQPNTLKCVKTAATDSSAKKETLQSDPHLGHSKSHLLVSKPLSSWKSP